MKWLNGYKRDPFADTKWTLNVMHRYHNCSTPERWPGVCICFKREEESLLLTDPNDAISLQFDAKTPSRGAVIPRSVNWGIASNERGAEDGAAEK